MGGEAGLSTLAAAQGAPWSGKPPLLASNPDSASYLLGDLEQVS